MRVKSKYRQQYRDGGRVDLPGEQPTEQPIESAPPEAPPAEATVEQPPQQPVEPQPELPQQDGATLALKKQIESLRQSEQLQRQQAAMPQQEPLSREQRLAAWRQQGISEAEAHFFQRNPEMIDHPQITGLAVNQAKQAGHQRGTDAHFDFVKKAFDANLAHLQAQANPDMQPTPQFFKPPPGPPTRSAPNPSALVSAPVSHSIPSGSGARPRGKITLTPTEVEAARVSGVSIEEYARQKSLYENMKADGSYRDNRDQR
jgi:hypothetical protein